MSLEILDKRKKGKNLIWDLKLGSWFGGKSKRQVQDEDEEEEFHTRSQQNQICHNKAMMIMMHDAKTK